MPRLRLLFLAVFALALFTGCNSYSLGDDIQIDFRLFPLVPIPVAVESLHLPYVQGTHVDISILGVDQKDAPHFVLTSDDNSVLTVDSMDTANAIAHCTAHAPGTAGLHVLQDGSEVYADTVSVAAPTSARLSPAGPLFVGEPMPFDAGGTTEVLNGGTATYLVEYFRGDQQLFGNGVLSATGSSGIETMPEKTFFLQVREWLQVTPTALGKQQVQLSADGIPLATLTVDSVDPSTVTTVGVESEDPSGANDGDWLVVLAQSFDAKGEPIFGVDYDWNLAGEDQTGEGDLFRFPLDSSQSSTITATFGGHTASTTIEAKPGTGFVDSSNDIGCSASPGAPAGGAAGLALVALGLVAAARRRR